MLMSREAGPQSGITNSFGEMVASFCENPYTCSDAFCHHASSYMDNNKIVLALLFQNETLTSIVKLNFIQTGVCTYSQVKQ